MLLTGTHPRSLDDKNRMTLPKRVPSSLAIQRPCLSLRVQTSVCGYIRRQVWRNWQESSTNRPRPMPKHECSDGSTSPRPKRRVDEADRILVPDRLAHFAGLQHEVVLIGVRDHLELWNEPRWQQYLTTNAPRFDAVAEGAFQK